MIIPNKTLVIRFSSIGDVVLASPLIRVLRKRFPSSQIDFVVRKEYSELIRYNPNLNHTFEFDAQGGFRNSIVWQTQYDTRNTIWLSIYTIVSKSIYSFFQRSKRNYCDQQANICTDDVGEIEEKNYYQDIISVADRYIEPVRIYGIENDVQGLEIFIPDETLYKVSGIMSSLMLRTFEKVVGFCPSAKHATKRWPERTIHRSRHSISTRTESENNFVRRKEWYRIVCNNCKWK